MDVTSTVAFPVSFGIMQLKQMKIISVFVWQTDTMTAVATSGYWHFFSEMD